MLKCPLCQADLTEIRVRVSQDYNFINSGDSPTRWLFLSPEEINIYQIPLPKECTGQAVCKNCGASCELVGINENEFIVMNARKE